ncbi:hypothetical protein BJ322DRAFT_997181 [Thelephora terrestris]|uniref:Uncharacterized protein n=1 Tax=Thelephora terrestris TaxID=56493 RepID=A0A9P6HRC5_9AGAM|nr:hypothetical protein BJ322DRAFT_997181 [Thelephora terrestris]
MPSRDFEEIVKQEEARLRIVHPTAEDIPGCMTLLDDFLSCNILGVQLKSLYRYGEMSKCGQKMGDFKFCMANKSLHPEDRRDAWIHRRAEWWAKRRLEKSSEDVWEIRKEPLKNFPPENLDHIGPTGIVLA